MSGGPGARKGATPAEQQVLDAVMWAAPRLPALRSQVPRWQGAPTWTPPGTILLVRHRSLSGGPYIVSNDRQPPPGFEIEFDLGVLHRHAQPGTNRLIDTPWGGFATTRIEGEMAEGCASLGWIEDAPFPLLNPLELRSLPDGRVTLVAGVDDPLHRTSVYIATLGFIDAFPIEPRHRPELLSERSFGVLRRSTDTDHWRHAYDVVSGSDGHRHRADTVALGGLLLSARTGYIPLSVGPDGVLSSPPPRSARGAKSSARWTLAPLSWSESKLPPTWAFRAVAGRARRLRTLRGRSEGSASSNILGYLRPSPAPGWSPLYSCHHPVLLDRYLTLSEIEARDLGFVVDGVLGYVLRRLGDADQHGPHEIAWGSRFGHRRRWREGAA